MKTPVCANDAAQRSILMQGAKHRSAKRSLWPKLWPKTLTRRLCFEATSGASSRPRRWAVEDGSRAASPAVADAPPARRGFSPPAGGEAHRSPSPAGLRAGSQAREALSSQRRKQQQQRWARGALLGWPGEPRHDPPRPPRKRQTCSLGTLPRPVASTSLRRSHSGAHAEGPQGRGSCPPGVSPRHLAPHGSPVLLLDCRLGEAGTFLWPVLHKGEAVGLAAAATPRRALGTHTGGKSTVGRPLLALGPLDCSWVSVSSAAEGGGGLERVGTVRQRQGKKEALRLCPHRSWLAGRQWGGSWGGLPPPSPGPKSCSPHPPRTATHFPGGRLRGWSGAAGAPPPTGRFPVPPGPAPARCGAEVARAARVLCRGAHAGAGGCHTSLAGLRPWGFPLPATGRGWSCGEAVGRARVWTPNCGASLLGVGRGSPRLSLGKELGGSRRRRGAEAAARGWSAKLIYRCCFDPAVSLTCPRGGGGGPWRLRRRARRGNAPQPGGMPGFRRPPPPPGSGSPWHPQDGGEGCGGGPAAPSLPLPRWLLESGAFQLQIPAGPAAKRETSTRLAGVAGGGRRRPWVAGGGRKSFGLALSGKPQPRS